MKRLFITMFPPLLVLWLFKVAGRDNSNNTKYQFWKPDNQPELCYELKFMWQKLNYMHNNPIVAGVVYKAEDYVYSSAADYFNAKQVGKVKVALLRHYKLLKVSTAWLFMSFQRQLF